jgi:hypothetical protein
MMPRQLLAAAAGKSPQVLQPDLERLDWTGMLRTAHTESIEALLYAALQATRQLEQAPLDIQASLLQVYWRTRIATGFGLDQLAELLVVFGRQEIPVIVLKGAALALALYDEPGLRLLGDIDLLVQPADVAAIMTVLIAQGFGPLTEMQPDFSTTFRNERTFLRTKPPALQIDLHWELSARNYLRRRIPMAWFWSHTVPLPVRQERALMFNPEAMLLHLCMHAFQHGNHSLRWSYDIALLLERWPVDWNEVLAVAMQSGLVLALQTTLQTVGREWGVHPPPGVLERIAQLPVDWRQHMLQRFCAASDTSGLNLVDALNEPSLRRTFTVWRRMAFPSPAYMRYRYGAANKRALAACYAKRILTGGKRMAHSIEQALGT